MSWLTGDGDDDGDQPERAHVLKIHDFNFGGETVTVYVHYSVERTANVETIELDRIELFGNDIYAYELPEAVLLNFLERITAWHDALQHWHSA